VWCAAACRSEGRPIDIQVREGPSELIRITLEFFRPFAATNTAEFTFRPEGNQTLVTWSMSGRNNFVAKAMCLVVNMDGMVGGQFEKGLAKMKSIVERARPPVTQHRVVEVSDARASDRLESGMAHRATISIGANFPARKVPA
jgi:hypothetical protein